MSGDDLNPILLPRDAGPLVRDGDDVQELLADIGGDGDLSIPGIPGAVPQDGGGPGGGPDAVGLGEPPVVGGALEPQSVRGGDIQERPGLDEGGIGPVCALYHVGGDGAGVGGNSCELLHGDDAVRLIVLG